MPYEATTQALFAPYLKNMWNKGRIIDLTGRDSPIYAMIPKAEDFFGEDQKVNMKHRNPMGRSANSQKAQSNARSGRGVRFNSTRKSNHQSVFISNETIEASANDQGALLRVVDDQMEGAVDNLMSEVKFGIFRNGGGTRGRANGVPTVPGGGAPNYITLQNLRDAKNFEIGMVLKAGTTDGTTATTFRTTPATNEVTGVDRTLGRVYFADGTFAGTNWANNDFLSVDGDIDESTLLGKYISGFDAWIPPVAPGAGDNFKGVPRGQDPDRLAGLRYNGVGKSIENALLYAVGDLREVGGRPDVIALGSRQWSNLAVSLGTRINYDLASGSKDFAAITFKSIVLPTSGGAINVVADPYCQDDTAWILEMATWKWHTLGPAPKPNLHSANNMLDPSVATDDVEMRWVYRGDVECQAPGRNARVAL